MKEKSKIDIESKYLVGNIDYKTIKNYRKTVIQKSIKTIGLDVEADPSAAAFMICTSEGDVFSPDAWPQVCFERKYRGKHFVCYNLKYDEGHLVRFLPRDKLEELWKCDVCEWNEFKVTCIAKKMLKISYRKNCITIWDIASFFKTSLAKISHDLLKKEKIDLDPKKFTPMFIKENFSLIAEYCINDAILTQELAEYLIEHFEKFDVYPRKLYSTAYISGMYFSSHCDCPKFNRFWNHFPEISQFALASYRGGKFEVTEKGVDNYYEYDINSAYPYEISELIDITHAQVVHEKTYRKEAVYGFLLCRIILKTDFHHTVSIKKDGLCVYPIGDFYSIITKNEYEYFLVSGHDIEIIDAYWLETSWREKPYKTEIEKLYKYKAECKEKGRKIDYAIIKMFLNAFYGKKIQLIKTEEGWKAGKFFHPIYAAVITANTRIRISKLQNEYPSIVACFTDSVISTCNLNLKRSADLGSWDFSTSGKGVILGSGIYQIGSKTRFRGFRDRWPLWWMLDYNCKTIKTTVNRPYSWREVIFHGWNEEMINKFVDIPKKIDVDFDRKRVWIDDWKKFSDVIDRKVYSVPRYFDSVLGLM